MIIFFLKKTYNNHIIIICLHSRVWKYQPRSAVINQLHSIVAMSMVESLTCASPSPPLPQGSLPVDQQQRLQGASGPLGVTPHRPHRPPWMCGALKCWWARRQPVSSQNFGPKTHKDASDLIDIDPIDPIECLVSLVVIYLSMIHMMMPCLISDGLML